MSTSFFKESELANIGLISYGKNVLISRKASIYNANKISIGDNVRIDDFCILSGNISIGSYVHIAAYTALYGSESGIVIKDFVNISSRVCIYAVGDDYSGESMTSPLIPNHYKHTINAPVNISRHVIIGSGCTILPGVTLNEGSSIGCMTLIKHDTKPWTIYAGIPARIIKERKQNILVLEKEFLENN